MTYLQEPWNTFTEQPIKIICTAFLLWAIFPVLIFALGGILFLIQIISVDKFTILFSNAIIPWWTSILINFLKFILEYLLSLIATIILVNHEIIEPIDFNGLIQRLRNL